MNAILKAICALPTAPFREQTVMAFIRGFCSRHNLRLAEDRYRNLLVGDTRPAARRWVLVAHMDHPGLEAAGEIRKGILRASFRGYVLAAHMRNTPVVFFDSGREICGKIIRAIAGERGQATEVHVRIAGRVTPGSPGMFDFDVAKLKGHLLCSRALDDLAGVAAALQTVLNHKRKQAHAHVVALLTRAEETGFIGAIAAAKDGKLIRKSDRLISIECSAMQPYAPQGKGVVVRVGDKTSVFDSAMTYHLIQTAQTLAGKRKTFSFQRALMPGGSCEATAFDVFGYRAAAVCIPLGNYHNMVPGKKRLGAEYIDLRDWQSLVDLLTAVTLRKDSVRLTSLKTRFADAFARHRLLLTR